MKNTLKAKGCIIQQEEKEWYTPEELFPHRHAGHALQGARYRENMSQKTLSEHSGVSVQNISAMENGRRPIGKEMAKRLAAILHIDWKLFLQ